MDSASHKFRGPQIAPLISMACYLGTSGWTYDHWKGVFYPDTVPKTLVRVLQQQV